MLQRGWYAVDIVLISGDAYVDHPSFGMAVIGRVLEHQGYRVGIIAMPDWQNPDSIRVFGKPHLFFGVSAGNVDSMLARYTAFKRYRSDDPYVPGGKAGRKPERAVLAYCNLIKAAYKDVPLVIGGVEASMRRVAHYDFWSNKVRRSILEDARADILVYGMGEQAIVTIAERLQQRRTTPALPSERVASVLKNIPGTVLLSQDCPVEACRLPAEEEVLSSKEIFVEFYREFYHHHHQVLAQPTGKRYLLHYPPANITSESLDAIYALPFLRKPHPSYVDSIPGFDMIRHSVTAHRGCVSGCSFCSLALHQGKRIVSRSPQSVLQEVRTITQEPGFKGHITDIGGPSANMYGLECRRDWHCKRESCLFPSLCSNLQINTSRWVTLLQQAAHMEGVTLVTIGSGLRYDLLMRDPEAAQMLEILLAHHISGQLKIAPEHTDPKVLRAMRKIPLVQLQGFLDLFYNTARQQRKKRYLLPYLMSCHPGTNQNNTHAMQQTIQALFGFLPEQVQAFIPLPMTLSSVIYYTGIDPLTGEHFEVVRDMNERRKQHQEFTSPSPQSSSKKRKNTRSAKFVNKK